MAVSGNLSKMKVSWQKPVQYQLILEGESVNMNDLLGKEISLEYNGLINCVSCGKVIKKAYGQGFCYPCFIKSPMNSECIIRPELCRAHLGEGRDPEWEEKHHNQPHVVYLALSGGLKVGVTRVDQIPTRWIDQGAFRASLLAETPHRQLAGEIEVAMKNHLSDKTNWRKMLKWEAEDNDLIDIKEEILEEMPEEFEEFASFSDKTWEIHYPHLDIPTAIKSLNLDRDPLIQKELMAIRGQYLIFRDQSVINLRKFSGYQISLAY